MTVQEIKEKLGLTVCCGDDLLHREVTGGYAGDLLSDVMGNSKAGDIWVTMQVHVNIIAVAILKDLAAVILVSGRRPAEDTLKKARDEKIPILLSQLPSYEIAGKLYFLGVGSGA